MSELDYLKAVVLGVVQGLTEFLPVSSSGHLALCQRWMGLEPGGTELLLFDILAHLGTLLAVGIVFMAPALKFIRRLAREASGTGVGRPFAWRVAGLAIAATIPTGIIGLTFKDSLEAAFDRPAWIGAGLLLTGGCLAMLGIVKRGRRGWRQVAIAQAVLIGVAQGLAIMPGISRSGMTICVASYIGLRRRWAAQFSFLIAAPTIAGAAILKLRETLALPEAELRAVHIGPVILGSLVSLIVGVFALRLLLGAVRRARLHYFAVYCWLLGAAVLLVVR